jgi:long-subunit acyl-CoA synthetase (AMP-forming)
MKLDDDGELLIRSDVVMVGYRNLPEQDRRGDDRGRLPAHRRHRQFDDDGYLRIVDRKKEIIINAAGKNMSPANVEAALKASSPLIGQAVCIGDGRSYNTALIVLDSDFAPAWASQHGIEDASLEALAHDERSAPPCRRASTPPTPSSRAWSRSSTSPSSRATGCPAATS